MSLDFIGQIIRIWDKNIQWIMSVLFSKGYSLCHVRLEIFIHKLITCRQRLLLNGFGFWTGRCWIELGSFIIHFVTSSSLAEAPKYVRWAQFLINHYNYIHTRNRRKILKCAHSMFTSIHLLPFKRRRKLQEPSTRTIIICMKGKFTI